MPYGLTTEGFVIKPLEQILADIQARQRASLHPALNQTADSVLGVLNGIFAEKIRQNWELNEAVYHASDPDAAQGASLDNVAALCPGTIRRAATKSRVTATCNLDAGTYPAGTLVANVQDNPDARFVSIEDRTLAVGGNTDIDFEAEETGPIPAPAGTLNEIAEPVTGWNSVTNAAAAEIGENIETDAAFRLRREAEIRRTGSANVDAVRADVLEVEGVLFCRVYENTTDVIVNQIPPHGIMVVIWDGDPAGADDQEVARAIFDSKAGGIATGGDETESVEDSQGTNHLINFLRAQENVLEIQMTAVTTDPPADWQDQIRAALVAFVDAEQGISADVIYTKLLGVAVDFEWLDDLTLFEIRFSGGVWGTSNLTVADYAIATLTDTDIDFV